MGNTRRIFDEFMNAKWTLNDAQRKLKEAQERFDKATEAIRAEDPLLLMPITVLDLSQSTLKRVSQKYDFVWQLARIVPWQLPPGIGDKTYKEIDAALRKAGVTTYR